MNRYSVDVTLRHGDQLLEFGTVYVTAETPAVARLAALDHAASFLVAGPADRQLELERYKPTRPITRYTVDLGAVR